MKQRLTRTLTSQRYYIEVPCKPYIKKFAGQLYGSPVKANSYSTLGHIFVISLEKNLYDNRWMKEKDIAAFEKSHPSKLSFEITYWQFTHIGTDIGRSSVLQINRFLENVFDDFLYSYVSTRLKKKRYKGTKSRLLEFAEEYGLVVALDPQDDGDITIDALLKKYNRFGKKK